MRIPRLVFLAACGVAIGLLNRFLPADEREFPTRVAPILQRRCLSCHSGKDAKGGLNLSTAKLALKGGDSGAAIVPGNPARSLLLDMVGGKKPSMPKDGKPLSAAEVETLRKWIVGGARWPQGSVLKDSRGDWWSFRPLTSPAVPNRRLEPRDLANPWVLTPIDAFILRKLRQHGLHPSPEADRRTLIRRLSFDLHGLPPTPAEVDAFLGDSRPDAYDRLVDRLLASPRYGERWARHWLDVVHYGDTHGFDKDKRRPSAWPYRDWVIRAFNRDKPYREFVREQLAGDVLRPHDPRGVVATGFIVAGPWDFVGQVELREGTVDKKITRNLDRDDMVMNAMSTFNSLTVHCARCHDHKFDPIKQRDYYSLQAVFAGVERANRLYDADPRTAKRRDVLRSQQSRLLKARAKLQAEVAKQAGPELQRIDMRLAQLKSAKAARKRPEYGYHSGIERKPNVTKWVQIDLGQSTPLSRIEFVGCHDEFAGIGAGFGFPVRFRIDVSNDKSFNTGVVTVLDRTRADVPNPGVALQAVKVAGRSARYVRFTATKLAPRQNDFIFALAELAAFAPDGKNLSAGKPVTSLDSIEAPVRWRRSNLVDGISFGGTSKDSTEVQKRLAVRRDELLKKRVQPKTRDELRDIAARLNLVRKQLAALPQQHSVYAAAPRFAAPGNLTPATGGKPRPIFVLNRGSVTSPGEPAQPGTVALFAGLPSRFELKNPDDEGSRRLALANWLVDRRNPLTWRSIVNRVWQYHFGRGLVDSPNDFGRMGAKPTHPELLDWLAADFRDNGQSLKRLHRLIVTSAVYRQQSTAESGKRKAEGGAANNPQSAIRNPQSVDAGNRYLWRMNRRRLEAEALRDSVLSITGTLRQSMYGPGFDLFGFKDDHSPHYAYDKHDVDDPRSLRRSVYRFVVRSVPDPFLETLDCADPSLNVPKRSTTITALQALSLLNNRFMVRQAEHFATRIARSASTHRAQIAAAYRLALGRSPTPRELRLLEPYVASHGLKNFCRLLLNTNEFLFVD